MEPFVVTSAGDGSVRVIIPADSAEAFREVLGWFMRELELAQSSQGRFAWAPDSDPLVPAVHRDRTRSRDFRMLHSSPLRERLMAAAQRVNARLQGGLDFTLDPDAVADWVIVCGHAQSLYVAKRWGRGQFLRTSQPDVVLWLIAVQEEIADAALGHFVAHTMLELEAPVDGSAAHDVQPSEA